MKVYCLILSSVLIASCGAQKQADKVEPSGKLTSKTVISVSCHDTNHVFNVNGLTFRDVRLLAKHLKQRGVGSVELKYINKSPAKDVLEVENVLSACLVKVDRVTGMSNGPSTQAEYEEFIRNSH